MKIENHQRDYVEWQNRAVRFYLAARLLALSQLWSATAFCAQQALEDLLKATLLFHDKSFDPECAGHKFTKILRALKNKVPNSQSVDVPQYSYHDNRFRLVTRYPVREKMVGIPSSLLDDLDRTFVDLLVLVDFQFNTELKGILRGRKHLEALGKDNKQLARLLDFLSSH
jgi:HEPN domain-containing protein